ncbi:bifunctional RNase H/acid phosphatase [Streptomyces radicis]|uniref:Bifunctional RNase H/acid phosphatase n=1 Tax=Streptomyces radicis TaxID=1750517 RepID=A0A3A9WRD0_9ACTN|nr:bifunctional RNase H/acid phosphatase [Streptomyces radicis]RKN12094.1 bifunctional RNase H/acid phosphatase [Streptomyces radicis]RKN25853.1 bifunctional RNase H/acid phosphatase [Streptomyces radicis]
MTRFIIEADGGSRGNPGPAGYGAVVRDATTGELLSETAEYIGTATNNVAEYRGLIAGLRSAFALDPSATVQVRMDSKLVVEQMSGRWKIKHPDMRPLAAEAQGVFPPGAVRYEWIPRERNKDADRLANEAMDAGRRGERWRPRERAAEPAPAKPPAVGWGPSAGTPTTFLLLRHGETDLTPRKVFSGSGGSDPELSDVGRAQAAAAAAALPEVDAVISSPLVRCRQTAEPVAARLGLDIRYEEGFRETDFGAFEGLTFAEARERHPDALEAWLASPDAEPPGGGESFTAVARRVAVARDKTLARHPGRTVLVVTHVTPVKTLLRLALDAPPRAMFRMELSPAALTEVAYYADGNASVRRFNDTGHLR